MINSNIWTLWRYILIEYSQSSQNTIAATKSVSEDCFQKLPKFWIENIHNLTSTCNKSIPHPCLNSAVRKKIEGWSFKNCSDLFLFFSSYYPKVLHLKKSRDVLQQFSSLPSQCSQCSEQSLTDNAHAILLTLCLPIYMA